MFKLHTPLFNEVATDFGAADAAGDAAFMSAMSNAGQQSQAPIQQEAPAPKEAAKPVEQPKPEEKPKSLTDKLGAIEDPKEEEAQTGNEEPPAPAKGEGAADEEKRKNAWSAIKAEAKEAKRLAAELAEWKQKYETKAATALPPEVESELAELRQAHAVTRLQKTPEYQQTVTLPLGRIESDVQEIVEELGIDAGELWKAFGITTEWKRNDAINTILAKSEKELPGGVDGALHNAANRAHQVWQKQAELHQEAEQVQASYEYKSTETVQKQTAEQEAEWGKALQESTSLIENKLGSLLKGMPDAERTNFLESIKNAKISDDPKERAFQAQASHVAAVLVNSVNGARKEIAALKKERDALLNARPGTVQKTGEVASKPKSDAENDDEFMRMLTSA